MNTSLDTSGVAPGVGNETLAAALRYAARAWRVLPVHAPPNDAKKPRIKDWPNNASADPKIIRGWWKHWPDANVGIATGTLSGFFVLDVDLPGGRYSLDALEATHGALPDTVEAMTGGGGRHLLFTVPPGIRIASGIGIGNAESGLDIRADGGFIVAPPSVHSSGATYEWESSHGPSDTPIAPPPQWLLDLCNTHPTDSETQRTQNTQEISLSEFSEYSEFHRDGPSVLHGGDGVSVEDDDVSEAIRTTLPIGVKQRRRRIFKFARKLKAIARFRDMHHTELDPLIREWHQRALPVIGTKPLEDSLKDFAEAWELARYADGEGPINLALARAKSAPDPEYATRYPSDETRLLAKLCRELQALKNPDPFFLDCRTAGKMVGLDHVTAHRRLKLLERDRVLKLIERGSKASGKANVYRYIAAA